ncbi:autophagy-related protein 13-domain-containing protein [Sparassis latifolia]|uniref:Autophagy-related protein 13 n=1 Tax=Sparassis crispa TaxID=139825 RepID=A0A401GQ57_9APHY|nr:hypothetical protein SCP_0603360 [Sparassis crispa]GBE84357.1 hypothetical protein SCP_0603360 [Sparassis crispa]
MSSDKSDKVAYRFYTKLILVVNHARATVQPTAQARGDIWFNLETPDTELFKEHTRIYRSVSSAHSLPPFRLQVLLVVPELTNNQVLVYLAPDSSRVRIDPTPRYILLESWDIIFTQNDSQHRYGADVALPTMYKQAIPLFRSVFTLLRILPAWKLSRRLRTRVGGNRNGNFSIQLRVQGIDEDRGAEGILGFDTPLAQTSPRLSKDSHDFTPVTHPVGTLSLSVTYLTSPNFQLDELESLLSSRFLSLDEGPDFTPTLVKNQQRDSLSGSPGSLPVRMSLPRSPPSSVADRFVVPPSMHSRTTSLSGLSGLGGSSPRSQNVGLLPMRRLSNTGAAGSTSAVSDASSSRQGAASTGSRDDIPPVSALAARLRKESLGTGRGSDFIPSPGPVPIRRPINPVNPFKSSTLSSGSPSLHSPSPSLRQHSPLSSGGPSLPSRPAHTSPTSSRAHVPQRSGSKAPPSPVPLPRSSPPYAPSSLGGRSLTSVEGVILEGSPRLTGKRYSSSFGHRYAATGGVGSEGSAGSGAKEGERVASPSFLSTNTDDDDISAFVQDIDARKPLGGLREQSASSSPARSPHSPDIPEGPHETLPSVVQRTRSLSLNEPMLTTESAVDERLRQMNETFMASLQGLGGRRRERGDSIRARGGSTHTRSPVNPVDVGSEGGPERVGINVDAARVPPAYVRPRFASTGSARSGMSVASGEVLGRMDPEVEDDAQSDPGR